MVLKEKSLMIVYLKFYKNNIKHPKVLELRKLLLSKYHVLRSRREFFDRIFRCCIVIMANEIVDTCW